MIYYVEGPWLPYIVDAENKEEALGKCHEYEIMTYDVWAYCGFDDNGDWYEDYFPHETDFEIISEEEFNSWPNYNNLVNYDWEHQLYKSDTKCFCKQIKNKNYKKND